MHFTCYIQAQTSTHVTEEQINKQIFFDGPCVHCLLAYCISYMHMITITLYICILVASVCVGESMSTNYMYV